jgi:hypothetical protein
MVGLERRRNLRFDAVFLSVAPEEKTGACAGFFCAHHQ